MERVSLTEVCDFQGGTQPPKGEWIDHREQGYVRMLQIRDFTQAEKNNVEYVKDTKSLKKCNADDILIGRYGASVGKILTGLSGAYNVAIVKTIPDKNKIYTRYLFHYFNSSYFQNFIKAIGSRAAQAGFNKGDLENAVIPVLALDKQRKIAAVLDKVSDLIAKRRQQLDKLDLLVKSKFVEMFGDPVSNPMCWQKKGLKEVCTKLTDGTHFSPESFGTGKFKYITAKNIKVSGFDFSNITYVPEKVHRPIYERCNPEFGDILYIKDGATTGIAMVNSLREEFSLLSSVALLKQNRNIINGYFLCGVLNNNEMYIDIRSNMGGAAITRLTIAKLNKIQVIVPPIQLQNQFADFVEQTEKTKTIISQSLQKLETLKKALMQKYFG